jgi:hypothetical protein
MAWNFVSGSAVTMNTTANSGTTAFTSGCTTGNVIIVPVAIFGSGASDTSTTCTDTEGNLYFKVVSRSSLDGTIADFHAWWIALVTNGSGSTNTITLGFSDSVLRKCAGAFQYSSIKADVANSVDASNANAFSGTTMTGSISAANLGELLITCHSRGGGSFGLPLTTTGRTQRSPSNSQYIVADSVSTAGSNSYSASEVTVTSGGSTTVLFFLGGSPTRTLLGVGL